MPKITAVLMVFILALSACTPLPQTPPATQAVGSTPGAAPTLEEPTAPLEPAITSAVPTLTAAVEIRAPQPCRAWQSAAFPAVSYADAPELIEAFLNAGGSVTELDAGLYQAGILSLPLGTTEADLTGDGWLDAAVSLYNPASPSVPPEGRLLIYICQENSYRLAYQNTSEEFTGGQGLQFVQDLNGDGVIDLLTNSSTCGAHTCYEDIQILVWNGAEFSNRLAEPTSGLPYPETKILDPDGDGIYDLEVTGSGIGSVGAGPQRGERWLWRFQADSGFWTVAEKALLPSTYRVHMLHDGLQAAREQDFNQALLDFQRVISDASLEDWADPAAEQAALMAYARLQMITILSHLGQAGMAQAAYLELTANLGTSAVEMAIASLAQGFLDFAQVAEVSVACVETRSLAGGYELELAGALGTAAFGYGNPEFAINDICAWMP